MSDLVRFLSVGLAAAIITGCSSNDDLAVVPSERIQLAVVLHADTLFTPDGNVTHIFGYAQLTSDWRPQGLAGMKLNITLKQPWLSMSFSDPRLRNSTDDEGRVNFFVRDQLRRVSHHSTVCAEWGSLSACDSVWVEILTN